MGDIIWFSFTATYVVGNDNWGPEYRLIDLIRVGNVASAVGSRSEGSMFPPTVAPLELGTLVTPSEGTSS